VSEQAAPKKRSRKLYVLWGVALTLLLATGAFCWLVVVPILEARSAVQHFKCAARCSSMRRHYNYEPSEIHKHVTELGGRRKALAKLAGYVWLPDWMEPERTQAVLLMGGCGPEAVPVLLELSYQFPIQDEVAYALRDIGQPAVTPLAEALSSKDATVRFVALDAVFHLSCRFPYEVSLDEALEPLLALLRSGCRGDGRRYESATFCEPEDARMRKSLSRRRCLMVAAVLGRIGKPAIPGLEKIASSEIDEARYAAAEALKMIKAAGEKN